MKIIFDIINAYRFFLIKFVVVVIVIVVVVIVIIIRIVKGTKPDDLKFVQMENQTHTHRLNPFRQKKKTMSLSVFVYQESTAELQPIIGIQFERQKIEQINTKNVIFVQPPISVVVASQSSKIVRFFHQCWILIQRQKKFLS